MTAKMDIKKQSHRTVFLMALFAAGQLLVADTPDFSTDRISEGYVLIAPVRHGSTYLVDKAGAIVHEWKHERETSLKPDLLEMMVMDEEIDSE